MAKVRGLTQAQRERQEEADASKNILRKMNMIKVGVGAQTDEDFAAMIGVTYPRYRGIKRDPLSMRMRELKKVFDLGAQCGIMLQMDSTGLTDARA